MALTDTLRLVDAILTRTLDSVPLGLSHLVLPLPLSFHLGGPGVRYLDAFALKRT
jgi:hypothetical protein